MTLDEKIKNLDESRRGISETPIDIIFRWYFILMFNFPMIRFVYE